MQGNADFWKCPCCWSVAAMTPPVPGGLPPHSVLHPSPPLSHRSAEISEWRFGASTPCFTTRTLLNGLVVSQLSVVFEPHPPHFLSIGARSRDLFQHIRLPSLTINPDLHLVTQHGLLVKVSEPEPALAHGAPATVCAVRSALPGPRRVLLLCAQHVHADEVRPERLEDEVCLEGGGARHEQGPEEGRH